MEGHTVSKIERFGTNLDSVVHMLLFASGSMPDEGSSSNSTSGLPANLISIELTARDLDHSYQQAQ